jgi:hypothetical protein
MSLPVIPVIESRPAPFVSVEGRKDPVRLESLADQVPMQPSEFGIVCNLRAASKAFAQRRLEQVVGIEVREDLASHTTRRRGRYARLLDLPPDAQLAASLDGLRTGNRFGHTRVVEGPLLAKPIDRGVDFIGGVLPAPEALPDLRFGQLAPGQHPQRIEVGGALTGGHGRGAAARGG